jgi:threonine dehydrogenase-like Zn-dependent dehydrogenase
MMSRRMKHVYPRAIHLVETSPTPINLEDIVSHRFPLNETDKAFALNASYAEGVHKIVIDVSRS